MNKLLEHFEQEVIHFNREQEVDRICRVMRDLMRTKLNRRGVVIAVSGGIDSSVSAALSVKAFGAKKVFLLRLPENDSSSDTQALSDLLINHLKTSHLTIDISQVLGAIGCYSERDAAIRSTFPDYADDWKNKIVIRGGLNGQINHFVLVVQNPKGELQEKRLNIREYLQIVAATNYKQRVRKTIEYYHADRLNYAVIGTPNRLEYDQGFFVKNGDGSSDIKPIAHLYKSQVYALAEELKLPQTICNAIPTTDTYSLAQGQDEFFFTLPYQKMDKALWAHNNGYTHEELAQALDISPDQASQIYRDLENKRKTTQYLHLNGQLISSVKEIALTQ
jgi:NAD+ synthase